MLCIHKMLFTLQVYGRNELIGCFNYTVRSKRLHKMLVIMRERSFTAILQMGKLRFSLTDFPSGKR